MKKSTMFLLAVITFMLLQGNFVYAQFIISDIRPNHEITFNELKPEMDSVIAAVESIGLIKVLRKTNRYRCIYEKEDIHENKIFYSQPIFYINESEVKVLFFIELENNKVEEKPWFSGFGGISG